MSIHAYGTKISFAGTDVANVTNIGGPGLSTDAIETTAHDSAGADRTFIPGLKDAGELSLDINFDGDDVTHNAAAGVIKQYADRTVASWVLTFTDPLPTTATFNAFVTGLDFAHPLDDVATAALTCKITGPITWG